MVSHAIELDVQTLLRAKQDGRIHSSGTVTILHIDSTRTGDGGTVHPVTEFLLEGILSVNLCRTEHINIQRVNTFFVRGGDVGTSAHGSQ
ncbi:hypothetical protein [Bacteroides fragilis]|uniref:hypothetical protein n=1 Tax=Bacteroides fragilis TaxID=817 RepID=UPI00202F6945|nr:hypothetical protein [Bacteroides fragilis]MCE8579576.1 hypothetical protein [Bacteroides fragilis]MCE8650289.1 hypothetical protein [Bacteroides fragilis]